MFVTFLTHLKLSFYNLYDSEFLVFVYDFFFTWLYFCVMIFMIIICNECLKIVAIGSIKYQYKKII